jgi:hypothetical protein
MTDTRVSLALPILAALALTDWWLTATGLELGLIREANPVAAFAYEAGAGWSLLYAVTIWSVVLSLLVRIRGHFAGWVAAWAAVIFVGVVVAYQGTGRLAGW